MLSPDMLNQILEVIKKACLVAGEVHIKYFQKEFEINLKTGHQDLVTTADTESQKAIVDYIFKACVELGILDSEIGFIGEETLYSPARFTFVIDPLDGTTNFAQGIDFFGVSIGFFYEGKLISGVVYLPVLDQMYWGIIGEGSWLQTGEEVLPLKILPVDLKEALTVVHITKNKQAQPRVLLAISALLPVVRGFRSFGACVLEQTLLASNMVNLNIQARTFIWDLAASQAIVEGAGGMVSDWLGNKLELGLEQVEVSFGFISGHPQTVAQVIPLISEFR